MLRSSTRRTAQHRSGIILLVVLTLLTLFAVVGLSFVLFAESQATSSRINRESLAKNGEPRPDLCADDFANAAYSVIIYDTLDTDSVTARSSFRGHSMARTMYGYNSHTTPVANLGVYAGQGLITETDENPTMPAPTWTPVSTAIAGLTRNDVVQYGVQPGAGQIVDPEWKGTRTGLVTDATSFTNSTRTYKNVSAPYTYPDRKDFYLAVIDPTTGEVLQPSYYRKYGTFETQGGLNPANPEWTSNRGRYMVVRPRPNDHLYNSGDGRGNVTDFPVVPMNADGTYTGDVQNFPFSNGRQKNDSLWMYPSGPIYTWNGKQYTALVAPMIIDLGGRVNLSVAGNNKGASSAHASSQGVGPWEINPTRVFEQANAGSAATSLQAMLSTGTFTTPSGTTTIQGRYGSTAAPAADKLTNYAYGLFNNGKTPPHYAYADFNAATTSVAQDRMNPVGTGGAAPFPTYSATRFPYTAPTAAGGEYAGHPAQFSPDYFTAANTATAGRTFPANDLRRLGTRYADKPETYAKSELGRLAPQHLVSGNYTGGTFNTSNPSAAGFVNFTANDPANLVRQLVTTHSSTLTRPESAFTAILTVNPTPPHTTGTIRLGPIDLNRPLPDYRTNTANMLGPDNVGNAATAQIARQRFARDIFVRLAALSGQIDQTNVNYIEDATQQDYGYLRFLPTAGAATYLRALAQLAVNIVDYLDPDDVATTFTYNPQNPTAGFIYNTANGLPNFAAGTGLPAAELGNHVVFGTEVSRLVLNEAYAEVGNHRLDYNPGGHPAPGAPPMNKATQNFQKRFWVELFNPMKSDPTLSENGLARLYYPNGVFGAGTTFTPYSPYCIVVASPTGAAFVQSINDPSNVTGSPKHATAVADMKVEAIVDKYEYDPGADLVIDPSLVAPTGVIDDATFYTPNPASISTANSNLQRYVVRPSTGANGTSRQNANGFAVLGPAEDFPGQVSNAADPQPAGYLGATLRLDRNQMSTLDPAVPSALEVATTTKNETDLVANNLLKPHGIYLRRLANPYLPPNDPLEPSFNAANTPNPYVTVDRMENVTPNDNVRFESMGMHNPPTPENMQATRGKAHPFAAANAVQANQTTANGNSPLSSLFQVNTNVAAVNWLVHLDRFLTSPLEVVHVSAVAPSQLTNAFYTTAYNQHSADKLFLPGVTNGVTSFGGYTIVTPIPAPVPPNLAEGLLSNALDFLTVRSPVGSTPVGGREYGRMNVNTIWHQAALQALLDGKPAGDVNAANYFTDTDVQTIWGKITRTTGTDSRSLGFSGTISNVTSTDKPFYPVSGSTTLQNTILRHHDTAQYATETRPFYHPNPGTSGAGDANHTYVQAEPLRKMWQMSSTTSNTFLCIMTVGFFEVRGTAAQADGTTRVYLGKELFETTPGDLRQKYVSVIDRSYIAQDLTAATSQAAEKPFFTALAEDVLPGANSFKVYANSANQVYADGQVFALTGRTSLRLGFGDNSNTNNRGDGESVTVTGATVTSVNGIATVTLPMGTTVGRYHAAGSPVSNVLVGNPGPQSSFDYRVSPYKDSVIPYCVKVAP